MIKRAVWLILTLGVTLCVGTAVLFAVFPMKYSTEIRKCAEAYGLPPSVIAAQIKAESNFDAHIKSHKGAVGLMQVLPATAAWCAKEMGMDDYSEQMLENGQINIEIGTWYFSYLLNKTQNITWTIAAYNGGISNVEAWITTGLDDIEGIPFPETKRYVKKVLLYEKIYSVLYHLPFSH